MHEWRLVPPDAIKHLEKASNNPSNDDEENDGIYRDAGIIPSSIYGPIYLLRLFVKMPEILGRMKIPPKTSKILVKYLDSLLEYLESQPNLFTNESVYE